MADLIETLQTIIQKFHVSEEDVKQLQTAIDALESDDSLGAGGDDFSDPYGDRDDAMVIIAEKDDADGK
jgi:hypothetical protein